VRHQRHRAGGGFSRMHSGVHWLIVVFTGGPLAAESTLLFTRLRPLGPASRDRGPARSRGHCNAPLDIVRNVCTQPLGSGRS
jgi:hypothetical protein